MDDRGFARGAYFTLISLHLHGETAGEFVAGRNHAIARPRANNGVKSDVKRSFEASSLARSLPVPINLSVPVSLFVDGAIGGGEKSNRRQ